MKGKYSNFTLYSIHILRNQSPSAISEPVNYEMREGNELLWKKGFVYVFQFPNCFLEGMQRCNCFPARTSFLNTSYLFQSHYCNARFAYIRNPFYIRGTGALRVCGKERRAESADPFLSSLYFHFFTQRLFRAVFSL